MTRPVKRPYNNSMSRPKRNTMLVKTWISPEAEARLEERSQAQHVGKSEFVRLLVERELGISVVGLPAPKSSQGEGATPRPALQVGKSPAAFLRAASVPAPNVDDDDEKPWKKYGLSEQEWDRIPFEAQEGIKRGDGQVLKKHKV